MSRRVAIPLLSAVLVAANVLTGLAACVSICSSTRLATDDCCKRPEAGISAPRCCQGAEQVAVNAAPAATSRVQVVAADSAPVVVFAVPSAGTSSVALLGSWLVSTAAPPGATTLVGKRTSLLL